MLNISETYVLEDIIKDGGLEEIPKACVLIAKYITKEHSYPSKNIRLQEWGNTNPQIMEIVIAVFTAVLLEEPITYQAIVGRLNHLIKVKHAIDRFNIIADIIGLISLTGLIDVNKPGQGQYINITSNYEVLNIPEIEKHIIMIHRPQHIESNWDEEQHSMLLGHPMNHHEEEICLNHLNKLNAIPLQLNQAFVTMYKEKPKHAPKTPKAEDQWQQFMGDSFDKYMELLKLSQPFYLGHKYCTRGRTYACGYHVTTQGNGFKKAIIELYNEELVEG